MANPSPVSRKGVPNKINKELKDMILGALNDAGGQRYLAERAIDTPGPFLALVGKILPKEIKADMDVKGSLDFKPATEYLNEIIQKINANRNQS
jgi:hypothetical protein